MSKIAEKLALIVCEHCSRNQDESDIEFSSRLFSVYSSCYKNIEKLIEEKDPPFDINDSAKSYMDSQSIY